MCVSYDVCSCVMLFVCFLFLESFDIFVVVLFFGQMLFYLDMDIEIVLNVVIENECVEDSDDDKFIGFKRISGVVFNLNQLKFNIQRSNVVFFLKFFVMIFNGIIFFNKIFVMIFFFKVLLVKLLLRNDIMFFVVKGKSQLKNDQFECKSECEDLEDERFLSFILFGNFSCLNKGLVFLKQVFLLQLEKKNIVG